VVGGGSVSLQAVEVRDVTLRYASRRSGVATLALDGATLDIRRGEFMALVGPSGCGKSSLLNLVAGLSFPTAGQVLVDGKPVRGPGADRGVMFQDYALLPWKTVRENVEFGPRFGPLSRVLSAAERRKRVEDVIALTGLSGHERKYPRDSWQTIRVCC
jgi:NitT/TauT family transport system ATP-binding protein